MLRRLGIALASLGGLLSIYIFGSFFGWFGQLEFDRAPTDANRANNVRSAIAEQLKLDTEQMGKSPHKQILFGDLHVHTTYSIDAFQASLELMGGEGSHPPADACDFARFCSSLDFYSINDHAESLTPHSWQQITESVQQCNAVSGDPANPDLVAFLGWEWTHAGTEPENHYGHKNVVMKDYEAGQIPTRPIYAIMPLRVNREASIAERLGLPLLDLDDRQRAFDFVALTDSVIATPECEPGVHVKELPADCREGAATPEELFNKLDQWGLESMVIPHGNTWGQYSPPGTSWDKQLAGNRDDQQFLIEMFSGHGNGEEYRDWRAVTYDPQGNVSCPAPQDDYLPACWQAGTVLKERCLTAGKDPELCEQNAVRARQIAAENGIAWHNVVQGALLEEWLDAGQCQDCDQPSFNYRPAGSAQYALSLTNFDEDGNKKRFKFGLIGSSDNHQASPGTGYKDFTRFVHTETYGVQDGKLRPTLYGKQAPSPELIETEPGQFLKLKPIKRYELERSSSFYYTGGLVAVHSAGRDRNAIWDALQRKEVYATSGDRILLWFDKVDENGQPTHPMGSHLNSQDTPRFQVNALGAFKQKPGCPDDTHNTFGQANVENICRGECYNPSDERKVIERIEIVRVEPQMFPDEPIISPEGDSRIETVWKSFDCPADGNGCSITFSDEEFTQEKRDVVYYARAIQEKSEQINGGNLRCEYDDNGNCIKVNPCYGDDRTDSNDLCLAAVPEKAWSSPIFIDYAKP